ncbi:MAG: tyrosine-type recombinase/integrase [Micropruina sp.]|uniref:tyrosine-type recombinase/integrase n=1 Tax=Micropruina sp. TaxID=2737536 RepID=UPI0039E5A749
MANRRGSRRTFGSLRKLPSGRWQARYTAPDQREHKAPTTFQTRGDAEAWLAGEWAGVQRGEWSPPAVVAEAKVAKVATRFKPYAERVLARRELRETTRALYSKLIEKHLAPAFGEKVLAGITPGEVADWYAGLRAVPTSRANAYSILSTVMRQAVEDELIERSPCRVKRGAAKRRAKEPETLTAAELRTYLAAVPERYRVPLMLAGWCGLRSGEVRGLRRRDLDLDAGVVRVRQQVVKVAGQWEISEPKTAAGVRAVAIPPSLLPGLRTWLAEQPVTGRDGLLFVGRGGGPLSEATLRDAHNKGAAAVGKPGLTIHGLRHTSLTLVAQTGATIAELMARAGHTSPAMAMRYQHAAADRDQVLAAALDSL